MLALLLVGVSWRKSALIDPGNDPNFSIVGHQDAGLRKYNRKVVVFGVDVYAVAKVEERARVLQAGAVKRAVEDAAEEARRHLAQALKEQQYRLEP